MRLRSFYFSILFTGCLLTCAGFGTRKPAPGIGAPVSLSFDINACKLREDGYLRKPKHLAFSGKATSYGSGPLCTIQISKTAFEALFITCALSTYALEPGAMPAGTPASEYEKVFTQPRSCGFRYLDTSDRYIFEGFGPGHCGFMCLRKTAS